MKLLIALLALFLCFCRVSVSGFEIRSRVNPVLSSNLNLQVAAPTGKEYDLKLSKSERSVLHPNLKYFTVHSDEKSGRPVLDMWTPSQSELGTAEDLHLDEENRAVIRETNDHKGQRILEGVVDGMKFAEINGVPTLTEFDGTGHRDYIDNKVNLTYFNLQNDQSSEYVVEMAIVCDKEWGDLLKHDRQTILNYWTVIFWDLNMRYRTLPSSHISFRITSIIVIASTSGQPFIEDSRNEEGKISMGSILNLFAQWMMANADAFPKFDMSAVYTYAATDWSGGVAYLNGACNRRTGAVAVHADMSYNNNILAHEIGHNLGAPHDDDVNYPGGCSSGRSYLMSGMSDLNRFFFSECSDRTIKSYVSSDQGACLKRIDEPSNPVIPPDFDNVLASTMDEQCKQWMKNDTAEVIERDTYNCTRLICWYGPVGYYMRPIENSPCLYGRCFRGRCLPSDTSLLKNVASGQCVLSSDTLSSSDNARMDDCPTAPTPLEKYRSMAGQMGYWLMIPYTTQENTENDDKCLHSSSQEGGVVKFYRCSTSNPLHEWRFEDVGNSEYLVKEYYTQKCLKQDGTVVKSVSNCDRNDAKMRWRFTLTQEWGL